MNENWYALLIASQVEATPEQAFRMLDEGKIFTGREKGYSKLTEEELQCMQNLKHEGYTYNQIGQIYGISNYAVRSRIRRMRKKVKA